MSKLEFLAWSLGVPVDIIRECMYELACEVTIVEPEEKDNEV